MQWCLYLFTCEKGLRREDMKRNKRRGMKEDVLCHCQQIKCRKRRKPSQHEERKQGIKDLYVRNCGS